MKAYFDLVLLIQKNSEAFKYSRYHHRRKGMRQAEITQLRHVLGKQGIFFSSVLGKQGFFFLVCAC